MSIQFQNIQIQLLNLIDDQKIKTLDEIKEYIISNASALGKPSEPRRLLKIARDELGIPLEEIKSSLEKDNSLKLVLHLNNVVDLYDYIDFLDK